METFFVPKVSIVLLYLDYERQDFTYRNRFILKSRI